MLYCPIRRNLHPRPNQHMLQRFFVDWKSERLPFTSFDDRSLPMFSSWIPHLSQQDIDCSMSTAKSRAETLSQ